MTQVAATMNIRHCVNDDDRIITVSLSTYSN